MKEKNIKLKYALLWSIMKFFLKKMISYVGTGRVIALISSVKAHRPIMSTARPFTKLNHNKNHVGNSYWLAVLATFSFFSQVNDQYSY